VGKLRQWRLQRIELPEFHEYLNLGNSRNSMRINRDSAKVSGLWNDVTPEAMTYESRIFF
jgi:hypothetical protein